MVGHSDKGPDAAVAHHDEGASRSTLASMHPQLPKHHNPRPLPRQHKDVLVNRLASVPLLNAHAEALDVGQR